MHYTIFDFYRSIFVDLNFEFQKQRRNLLCQSILYSFTLIIYQKVFKLKNVNCTTWNFKKSIKSVCSFNIVSCIHSMFWTNISRSWFHLSPFFTINFIFYSFFFLLLMLTFLSYIMLLLSMSSRFNKWNFWNFYYDIFDVYVDRYRLYKFMNIKFDDLLLTFYYILIFKICFSFFCK